MGQCWTHEGDNKQCGHCSHNVLFKPSILCEISARAMCRFVMDWHYSYQPVSVNGLSYYYHLSESTFILKGIRSDFKFSYKFLMEILLANRIAPDGKPHSATSHLGLS